MADTKISALTAVTAPADADVFPGVQGGANFKWTTTQLHATHVAAADPHPGYVLESAAGTMHTQNANAVNITGGTITGITDLAVADGGTGSSTASGARTNLGLVIGTDVQAFDSDLSTLAGLTATTDNFIVSVSSAWASRTPAQVRTTLGLVIGTNVQAWDADLDTIAGLTATTDNFMVATSSAWASRTPSQARTQMGLGSLATLSSLALNDLSDVVISSPSTGQVVKYDGANWINDTDATGGGGGTLNDLTDVVITAAATGDILYYNGTNWVDQAVDVDLLTLSVPASTTISAFGASLVDDAAASNARTTLGVVIGTDVQAFDSDLTTLSTAFTSASASGPASLALAEDTDNGSNTVTVIAPASVASNKTATLQDVTGTIYVTGGTDVAVADGGTGGSDAATARTNLGLVIGTDVQAFDSDLNTIAGLTATTNNFMVATSSAWASRTPTQAIAHLGLDADIATLSLPASTTISTFGASLVDDADAAAGRTTLGAAATSHSHTTLLEKLYSVPGTLIVSTGVIRMYFKRAATVTNIYAGVGTAPTGAAIRIDVNKNGTTLFTTQGNRPDIAVSTNSDMTATPDVTSISAGDYLTVDIDVIGSTIAGADLVVGIEYTESIT